MRTPLAPLPLLIVAALAALIGCSSSGGIAVSLTCGDGHRDALEQCDDGNRAGQDGCSATCQFEQVQRMNSFIPQFGSDSICPDNAFGAALGSFLHGALQNQVKAGIQDGSFSLLMEAMDSTDLGGADQSAVTMGFLSATPAHPSGAPAYDGSRDLDWWYAPAASSLDANGQPKTQLTGSISSHLLTLGPATLTFDLGLGSPFSIFAVQIRSLLGAATAPTESSGGLPPGHLAAENLDPLLQSYASGGSSSAPSTFCGNISAQSLQSTKLTSQVTQYCTDYTTDNTLLDLFVSGCSVTVLGTAVRATQPDQVDASRVAAGAGGPYRLQADASSKSVNGCKDHSGATVDLATCVAAAGYSSYFKFTTDRVIIRSE